MTEQDTELSDVAQRAIRMVQQYREMGFTFQEVIELFDHMMVKNGKPRLYPKHPLYIFAQLAYAMKEPK